MCDVRARARPLGKRHEVPLAPVVFNDFPLFLYSASSVEGKVFRVHVPGNVYKMTTLEEEPMRQLPIKVCEVVF